MRRLRRHQKLTILGAHVVDGPGRPHLHREGLPGRHQREEGSERAVGDHLFLGGLPLADHGVLQVASIQPRCKDPPVFFIYIVTTLWSAMPGNNNHFPLRRNVNTMTQHYHSTQPSNNSKSIAISSPTTREYRVAHLATENY